MPVYRGSTVIHSGGGAGSLEDQYPSNPLNDGVTAASSVRATITAVASATPHTPGTWVEVDAALSGACSEMACWLTATPAASTANTATLLEIGTGASGSETVWATLNLGYAGAPSSYRIPGHIPGGRRVAIRVRSVVVSQSVAGVFTFLTEKTVAPGDPVSMGVDTATSRGTVLTAPGSLNTKGAWTQIAASTSAAFGVLFVAIGGAGQTTMAASGVLVDIGVGAAAAETAIISDVFFIGGSTEFYMARMPTTFGVNIPAGSRLSARYARAGAGNAVDLILVGA